MPERRAHWSGGFVFGALWGAYHGPVAAHAPHAHAAVQIVLADGEGATVEVEGSANVTGRTVSIPPLVPHSIRSTSEVGLLYLEAASPLARRWLARWPSPGTDANRVRSVEIARGDVARANPARWLEWIEPSPISNRDARNDARLREALRRIAEAPDRARLAEIAREVGLSPARLRSLAKKELGVPLATWRLWRKLERAARGIAAGHSLGDAAIDAGFADQAHLARTMRSQFGVAPRDVRFALRSPPA